VTLPKTLGFFPEIAKETSGERAYAFATVAESPAVFIGKNTGNLKIAACGIQSR